MSKVRVIAVLSLVFYLPLIFTVPAHAINLKNLDLSRNTAQGSVVEEVVTKPHSPGTVTSESIREETKNISPAPEYTPIKSLEYHEPNIFEKVLTGVKNLFFEAAEAIPTFLQKSFSLFTNDFTRNSVRISIFPPYALSIVHQYYRENINQYVFFKGYFPAVPEQRFGDGTAAYKTRQASLADFVKKEFLNTLASGAEVTGYTNASRNMRHYLANTGNTIYISPNILFRDSPTFKSEFKTVFKDNFLVKVKHGLKTAETAETFTVESDWKNSYLNRGDWYYAIGGFSYKIRGEVKVEQTEGQKTANIRYKIYIYDRYNWDEGKSVTILGFLHIEDTLVSELHKAGIAKEYEIKGVSEPYEYKYTPHKGDIDLPQIPEAEANNSTRTDVKRKLNFAKPDIYFA